MKLRILAAIGCSIALQLFYFPAVQAQLSIQSDQAGWKEFQSGEYASAKRIWLPRAEQGDGEAALGMAMLYENGLGMAKDIKQSVHWYEIAANKGIPEAQHDLGIKFFTGSGVKQNYDRAYNLWKTAAESGLGSAQAKLAYLYTQGLGTQQNYKEAVRWYRQAINQNNGEAMYNMSLLYQNGTGVRRDKLQFLHLLRQAATYGHSRAQYDLGLMLMHGIDVEKSVSEGKKWILESANGGLVDAQYYLGTLYLNGHILAPDREKAMILLNSAARQGHQGAKQTLLDLKLAQTSNSSIHLGNQNSLKPTEKPQKPKSSINKTSTQKAEKPLVLSGNIPTATLDPQQKDQNSWLLRQNENAYTIQLLASQDKNAAEKFKSGLPSTMQAFIFSFKRDDKHWYAVAAGVHTTRNQAAAALKKLPAKIRKSKPWIRKIGQLKTLINQP